jgi:hypothetical protein
MTQEELLRKSEENISGRIAQGVLPTGNVNGHGALPVGYSAALSMAERMMPEKQSIDWPLLSLLYFSQMGAEASKPGATVLGSMASAASAPAAYLMQQSKSQRERELKIPALAVDIYSKLGPGEPEKTKTYINRIPIDENTGNKLGITTPKNGYGVGSLMTLNQREANNIIKVYGPSSLIRSTRLKENEQLSTFFNAINEGSRIDPSFVDSAVLIMQQMNQPQIITRKDTRGRVSQVVVPGVNVLGQAPLKVKNFLSQHFKNLGRKDATQGQETIPPAPTPTPPAPTPTSAAPTPTSAAPTPTPAALTPTSPMEKFGASIRQIQQAESIQQKPAPVAVKELSDLIKKYEGLKEHIISKQRDVQPLQFSVVKNINDAIGGLNQMKIAIQSAFPDGVYNEGVVILAGAPTQLVTEKYWGKVYAPIINKLSGTTGAMEKARMLNQASRRAIELVLRARSGAAVPVREVSNYKEYYFPTGLDSQSHVTEKFRSLHRHFQDMFDLLNHGRDIPDRLEQYRTKNDRVDFNKIISDSVDDRGPLQGLIIKDFGSLDERVREHARQEKLRWERQKPAVYQHKLYQKYLDWARPGVSQ